MTTVVMTGQELKGKRVIDRVPDGTIYHLGRNLAGKIYNQSDSDALEEFIITAGKRQDDIHYSNLPTDRLIIDDKLSGVLLQLNPMWLDAKMINILPKKEKIVLLRQLIRNVKELTDNYIYPISIVNDQLLKGYPTNKIFFGLGLNQPNRVNIFGLDGNGTVYSQNKNNYLLHTCIQNLLSLICELMVDTDIQAIFESADGQMYATEMNHLSKILSDVGLPNDLSDAICTQKVDSYKQLYDILDITGHGYRLKIQ